MTTDTDYLTPVIERIEKRAIALRELHWAMHKLREAGDRFAESERPDESLGGQVDALYTMASVLYGNAVDSICEDVSQAGSLIARDMIAPVARESKQPIAWLTSNRFMPPLRDLEPCDRIWHADTSEADIWPLLVEAIEAKLEQMSVYMATPEHDNALYVVDLLRWEHVIETDNEPDNLNDEWRAKEQRLG